MVYKSCKADIFHNGERLEVKGHHFSYDQSDFTCFWVAFVVWFRLLKASINSRLRAVTRGW